MSTLCVNNPSCVPNFPTISAAVAAAAPGDTILVAPGVYNENVIINKSLTLLGAQHGVDAHEDLPTFLTNGIDHRAFDADFGDRTGHRKQRDHRWFCHQKQQFDDNFVWYTNFGG